MKARLILAGHETAPTTTTSTTTAKNDDLYGQGVVSSKLIAGVGHASVLPLLAELASAQDKFGHSSAGIASDSTASGGYPRLHDPSTKSLSAIIKGGVGPTTRSKRPITSFKRPSPKPASKVKRGKEIKATQDKDETRQEDDAWRASQVALERKAQWYDHLHRAGGIHEGSDDSDAEDEGVLVDFLRKEAPPQPSASSSHLPSKKPLENTKAPRTSGRTEEWVEITDEFGRSKIVPQSCAQSLQPFQVETTAYSTRLESLSNNLGGPSVNAKRHYDPAKEPRVLGTSHYHLSVEDEEQRRDQLAALSALSSETRQMRNEAATSLTGKRRRQALMEERRAKVAALRGGVKSDVSPSDLGGKSSCIVPEEDVCVNAASIQASPIDEAVNRFLDTI